MNSKLKITEPQNAIDLNAKSAQIINAIRNVEITVCILASMYFSGHGEHLFSAVITFYTLMLLLKKIADGENEQ